MHEMPGYGLKNFVVSILTIDSATGYYSYGTPKELPGARKLGRQPEVKKGKFWGDDEPMINTRKRGDTPIDLEVLGWDIATEALLLGENQDATTKYVEEGQDDTAPYCALGYTETLADGRVKVYWEYFGSFEATSDEYETFQGEETFRARKLRYTGEARPCDKKHRLKMDEDALPDGANLDSFFTAATLMDTVPAEYKAA